MSKHDFVVSRPKFIKFLLFNAERTVVYNTVEPLVDILTSSRDICGQIQKLF